MTGMRAKDFNAGVIKSIRDCLEELVATNELVVSACVSESEGRDGYLILLGASSSEAAEVLFSRGQLTPVRGGVDRVFSSYFSISEESDGIAAAWLASSYLCRDAPSDAMEAKVPGVVEVWTLLTSFVPCAGSREDALVRCVVRLMQKQKNRHYIAVDMALGAITMGSGSRCG